MDPGPREVVRSGGGIPNFAAPRRALAPPSAAVRVRGAISTGSKMNAFKMDANIVILGSDSVGKSALTVRFLTRRFIGEYGDIESIYSHNICLDGREMTLNIWDSPYSQDFSQESLLCEKRLQWADGFVLVYSICDRSSFNTVSRMIHCIRASKDLGLEKMPIIIVGNKRDLHHRRTVFSEEGRLLALSSDCHFYEVSAAENYHSVLMVFHALVDRIRECRSAVKKPAGIRGIVKSMSAVFNRKRTDSL
ncbi:ras-related and estrogen-regulated growth inhibitor-like protein [Denticeps clupeoides]|uniref:small monomeric GTPase n=1 Tax=Denticeps clupeoides TaxID=299321 RepID=A0AAY4BN03_9TELE|nr:ras-related and estrogen-regulated growth inhibitor-like protein [Denticeps clupeoides]